jgi:hypothetical protein
MASKSKKLVLGDDKSLTKVKLVYGGLHGVVVSYKERDMRKKDVAFENEYKNVSFGAPATGDMQNLFVSLANHLLDVCGYQQEEIDRAILLNGTEVTGVSYAKGKGFILTGTLDVLDGHFKINLVTPLFKSEADLPAYGDIVDIIEGIYAETKEYLSGNKRLKPIELIEAVNAKEPIEGFDKVALEKMTHKEQVEKATQILELAGGMVIIEEEEEAEIESAEKTITFDKDPNQTEIPMHEDEPMVLEEEHSNEPKFDSTEEEAEGPVLSVVDDEDDFTIAD